MQRSAPDGPPDRVPCRICGAACGPVIDFGPMPIANGFLLPDALDREERFPLEVVACPQCAMVQLAHPVAPERLFPADYAFHSSTSERMAAHFERFATWVRRETAGSADPLVVEIGSNDGILLRHLAAAGVRHVGVEPAADVAAVARSRGVHTVTRFFDAATAEALLSQYGPAHAVVGANVLCHIADIHSVAAGIAQLLAPDGVFAFEDPYLGDILGQVAFDQLYDEHVYYFSLTAIQALFARHGLEVVDVAPQSVHGGSMRYVLARSGRRAPTPAVQALAAQEERLHLREGATYARFREGVAAKRLALRALLRDLRGAGRRVVGYAATSKSTTAIVHCGLTPDDIEYICDTTPGKQGRLSPGAHIPVRPSAAFAADAPDYALLFAWNHRAEVLAKEQAFVRRGGRFITYVPRVEVLDAAA
jgi:methylation protein EvaC